MDKPHYTFAPQDAQDEYAYNYYGKCKYSNAIVFAVKNSMIDFQVIDNDKANIRPLFCKLCSASFAREVTLQCHKMIVHRKMATEEIYTYKSGFECSDCSKIFSTKDNLMMHFGNFHGTVGREKYIEIYRIKPYSCTKCEKSFNSPYDVNLHFASQHFNGSIGIHDIEKENKPTKTQKEVSDNNEKKEETNSDDNVEKGPLESNKNTAENSNEALKSTKENDQDASMEASRAC